MIIGNLPVSFRDPGKWLKDLLHTEYLYLKKGDRSVDFLHLIYFSCGRDFDAIVASLKSLKNIGIGVIKRIYIYEDEKNPFSDEQRDFLSSLYSDVEYGISRGFGWDGIGTIETELNAFSYVAGKAAKDDFVAKVDSDILFVSGKKIQLLRDSSYDFVGDGRFSRYKFTQGGLYFIRAETARRMSFNALEHRVLYWMEALDTASEDKIVFSLIKDLGAKNLVTSLMLFPAEFHRIRKFKGLIQRYYCAMHFIQHKEEMPEYLKKIIDD